MSPCDQEIRTTGAPTWSWEKEEDMMRDRTRTRGRREIYGSPEGKLEAIGKKRRRCDSVFTPRKCLIHGQIRTNKRWLMGVT